VLRLIGIMILGGWRCGCNLFKYLVYSAVATGQVTLANTPHHRQVTVAAMLQMGTPIRSIVRQMRIGKPTIDAIRRTLPSNLPEIELIKKRLVGRFYANANEFMNHITPDKLESASAYQLVGMSTLSVQAARDMEGLNRPVFNVVDIAMNLEKLIAESEQRRSAIASTLTSTVKDEI